MSAHENPKLKETKRREREREREKQAEALNTYKKGQASTYIKNSNKGKGARTKMVKQ